MRAARLSAARPQAPLGTKESRKPASQTLRGCGLSISSRELEPAAVATALVQAKCAACAKRATAGRRPETEEELDRQATDSVERGLSSKSNGSPLPEVFRSEMETAFGADFSGVRVHTNQNAVQMNQDVGAKAFTHGQDIYFNSGAYNPGTYDGEHLLAHELTHVLQQSRGTLKPDAVPPDITTVATQRVQTAPNVTDVNGPAEIAAGRVGRAALTATAAPGTVVNWSITAGAGLGATLARATGRTNTLNVPAASTGGVVTIQAEDSTNAADAETHDVTLVEIQQPTFVLAPVPAPVLGPGIPANTVEASVCGNTADADVVTVPGGRPVTWSIVGNARGATIDAATGIVTPPVTNTGNIVVRATDNAVRDARNQQTLTIRAHPKSIERTIRTGPVGAPYGSVYDHIFVSSGGPLTGVDVSEHVFCGSDPFGFCPGAMPVLPGLPNVWTVNAARRMVGDFMATPAALPGIDVNQFLPSPPNPGLPQVLTTPQILYWRSEQCGQWIPFQNVPIDFILRRNRAGAFQTITINNRVPSPPEAYAGPALAAPGAPAGSVCNPGEGLSNVTFAPAVIGADASAQTTTAGSVRVRPGGNQVTWSFPGPNLGAGIAAQGNPALFTPGNIAGQVRVRVEMAANAACFAEGWLRMQEVVIGPGIKFSAASVRPGGNIRATVPTKPGPRIVVWSIQGAALGSVIVNNADSSATITAGAQVGRITIRATDDRDATRFADKSLVIR